MDLRETTAKTLCPTSELLTCWPTNFPTADKERRQDKERQQIVAQGSDTTSKCATTVKTLKLRFFPQNQDFSLLMLTSELTFWSLNPAKVASDGQKSHHPKIQRNFKNIAKIQSLMFNSCFLVTWEFDQDRQQKVPLQRPLNQDYKTEDNRRENVNQRENKSRRRKKKKGKKLPKWQSDSLFPHSSVLNTAWAISQGAVIHRLERAQQGSRCRIPTCTRFFTDRLAESGIRKHQQVGQYLLRLSYLLTRPTAWCCHTSFLRSTSNHCFQGRQPLQSLCRENE